MLGIGLLLLSQSAQANTKILITGGGNALLMMDCETLLMPGGGDDALYIASRRTVIIVQPGWGHDMIIGDCGTTRGALLIFGAGIRATDIVHEGNIFRHRSNGDTVTLAGACIETVFTTP